MMSFEPRSRLTSDLFCLRPFNKACSPSLPRLFLARSRQQNCYEGKLMICPRTLAEWAPNPYSFNLIFLF